MNGLGWPDYLVLFAYFAAITAMAAYFSRRQISTEVYFLGGRSVPWWAMGMSMLAIGMIVGSPLLSYVSTNLLQSRKKVIIFSSVIVLLLTACLAFLTDGIPLPSGTVDKLRRASARCGVALPPELARR